MNDKLNAQATQTATTPDSTAKETPIDRNCCTIPPSGDPGPGR